MRFADELGNEQGNEQVNWPGDVEHNTQRMRRIVG